MLRIDPDLRAIIPPLQAGELSLLEASILAEGCREPLIVWAGQGILVDGHNRYDICARLGLPYQVREQAFADRYEVEQWICQNQLGRRNLTDMQRADLIGRMYNEQKKAPSGRADRDFSGDQNDHPKTADRIAEQQHVSAPTVKRDATFSEALDILEELGINRHEITNGARKLRKNAILKLAELAERNPDAARASWAKVEAQSKKSGAVKAAMREVQNEQALAALPPDKNDLVSIVLGDFREQSVSLASSSVDAIITDPPYPAEYLPLWGDLAKTAMRLLKPGGWCIVYSGKQHLDTVLGLMTGAGLLYYWQVIFLQTVVATDHARAVNTQYKPILLFQKPPITKPAAYFADVIKGEKVEKDIHEWQQSENGFEWLIERFTNVGNLVLDPFCGAGTVPFVAIAKGRRCIAYEIDKGTHAAACLRVFGRI